MNILFRKLTGWFIVRFWASPHHSMHALISTSDLRAERVLQTIKAFDPGFPRDDPPPELPSRPARPFPTDVPAPEPHDVPAREPIDVPPPDPGEVPPPAKPPERPKQEPRPRPIP